MNPRGHASNYDAATTTRCERALVTLLGDIGPWRERLYLVGGLVPRYLVGSLPPGAQPHIGTLDIDLCLGFALEDESEEAYRTLQNNLEKSGFRQQEPSFRWEREVDGSPVILELLCDTDRVAPGRIFKPRLEAVGSRITAFNVVGARLAARDYAERTIEGERLDGGGRSRTTLRIANILPYATLKIRAYQERHQNKDVYDLGFVLLNHVDGPRGAGREAAGSPVVDDPMVADAMALLAQRFANVDQDGPVSYAEFLAEPGDDEQSARLRREGVAIIREFLGGFREGRERRQ